jgi:hypothetical protein
MSVAEIGERLVLSARRIVRVGVKRKIRARNFLDARMSFCDFHWELYKHINRDVLKAWESEAPAEPNACGSARASPSQVRGGLSRSIALANIVRRIIVPTPLFGDFDTRFTAKAIFGPGVNQWSESRRVAKRAVAPLWSSQPVDSKRFAAGSRGNRRDPGAARERGAGERKTGNRVNHTQVVTPQVVPFILTRFFAKRGVNLPSLLQITNGPC